MLIEIKSWFTGSILVSGEYASIKECLEKNRGANLYGANLCGANLYGANLRGANLYGAKNYLDQHPVFTEIIRRQKVSVFSDLEWSAIAQITIHTLCWNSIKKRFSGVIGHVFEVLAEAGYTEWLDYWNKINQDN